MSAPLFWAITLSFLVGVFVRSFYAIDFASLCYFLLLAGAFFALAYLDHSRRTQSLIAACALLAAVLGMARLEFGITTGDPVLESLVNSKVTLVGQVVTEPDERENSTLVQVDVYLASSTHVSAGVQAILPSHALVAYGDTVEVTGTLRHPEAFDTTLGRQFPYPQYLAARGIQYQLSFAQSFTKESGGNPIIRAALWIKKEFERGIEQSLPEPEAALAAGVTVGTKRALGPELTDIFRRVSLTHVIVVSGHHMTVIINALQRVLTIMPRGWQFGTTGFAVVFFILLTGASASAIRAGIMALIAAYARISGREFYAARALVFAACGMVLWNPLILAFDLGFQLSALATLGLIYITPIVERYIQWMTNRWKLREIAATTVGAQIAVTPLLLYQSGILSIVSLPANLLALFPIPLAMFFTCVAALSGLLLGPLAPIFSFPAYILLWYVINVAELLVILPFASYELPAFGPGWLFFLYALLVGITLFLQLRHQMEQNKNHVTIGSE